MKKSAGTYYSRPTALTHYSKLNTEISKFTCTTNNDSQRSQQRSQLRPRTRQARRRERPKRPRKSPEGTCPHYQKVPSIVTLSSDMTLYSEYTCSVLRTSARVYDMSVWNVWSVQAIVKLDSVKILSRAVKAIAIAKWCTQQSQPFLSLARSHSRSLARSFSFSLARSLARARSLSPSPSTR